MLESLGAEIDTTHHNHIKIKIGHESKSFKSFHKMLGDIHEIKELQHLLESHGLAPNPVE